MRPLVSVIMPTFNRASFLPKAIDSVLNQTYPEIELIVVNDGSEDNTEEILEQYQDKIIYIRKENGGCGDAKNAGLKVAKGKYITHVDDDDLMLPQRVERMVEFFAEHCEFGLCATSTYLIDIYGQVIGLKRLREVPQKTRLLHLLMGHVAVQSNMMVPGEVFEFVGKYATFHCEDYDMWLRIARYYKIGMIEEPLLKYRRHSDQITAFKNHIPVMASLKEINRSFVKNVSMREIIPNLEFPAVGHAIIGAILCRHKLFDEAEEEIQRAPKDGTAQLWKAILFLYRKDFDQTRKYLRQVPQGHPCYSEIPIVFSLIDRTENLCIQLTAKDNNKEEVIQLRKDLQLMTLRLFNETLKIATGGKVCLKD